MDDSGWRYPRSAPFIIVATVQSNQLVGAPVDAVRFLNVKLQLHRVACNVENVLRGRTEEKALTFYYFADVLQNGGRSNPLYKVLLQARTGQRYIFCLTKEHGVYRSIGDVGDFTIRVRSGSHPDILEVDEPTNLFTERSGYAIADILLKPGVGFDPAGFTPPEIETATRISDSLGSMLHTVSLLKDLLKQAPAVRAGACYSLTHFYPGQYECWKAIEADPEQPAQQHEFAREQLKVELRHDDVLRRQLADPVHWGFANVMNPDSLYQNFEYLQLMLDHPQPDIRELACQAIRRFFPDRSNPRCH